MSAWPPKDWRAIIALLGSIFGAAVLTCVVAWGMYELLPAERWWTERTEAHRAATIRWVLWIMSGTIGLVIVGLGMAINRRTLRGNWGEDRNFEFSGGDEDPAVQAAERVAKAGGAEAEDVRRERQELPQPTFGHPEPEKPII